jgi:hypothetical protein
VSDPRLTGGADPAADPAKIADPNSTVSRADPAGTGPEQQANIDDAPTGAIDTTPTPLPKLSRQDAQQVEFPSLHGQVGVEVAERSSDVTVGRTRKHRKVFRVFDWESKDFDHGANFTATRQYMASHGLRPIGDVAFVGAEPYDDRNTDLVYEVEAIPAQVATDPAQAHVVVSQV